MAEDIDLFPLFSKVHTCGCLKHFFPRNVHLFSAKLWYDNTLCQGTINLPSFANDCLLKSSCNCILQGDEIIPHPPWEWKTLKTQGKPLKTQGTQFFGIFRILWCEKDVPKKTLDAFIHFHTLSYALEGFTCAKKQNVVPSPSSTHTNVRLSRCAAGKKLRNLIFWERPFANLEVDLQPLTFRAQAGMVKQFKACSVVARCSPYSWIPEWGGI